MLKYCKLYDFFKCRQFGPCTFTWSHDECYVLVCGTMKHCRYLEGDIVSNLEDVHISADDWNIQEGGTQEGGDT